jgi:hypothetical protein
MYATVRRFPILLLIGVLAGAGLTACSSAQKADRGYSPYAESATYSSDDAASVGTSAVRTESAAAAPSSGAAPRPSAAQRHAVADSRGAGTAASGGKAAQAKIPEVEEEPKKGQLLIYTGSLVLAIYEVEKTQDKAIAMVDEMGGYVSDRTSTSLVARVPAAKFRSAMEEFEALGDVLDRRWKAQDVTDQVRDLDIRLRNALGLRDRLEALLEEAKTVEDALKIEKELERITLEIERIRGQLESFKDRIAYSTIQISFRAKRTNEVPKQDFLLPYQWLNTLGLQSLFRSPRVYR